MQLLINVLQNRYYYKFPKIHKKISVLEPLFVEVTGLMDCNFIKKETPTQTFFNECHKIFEKSSFYGAHSVAVSKNG